MFSVIYRSEKMQLLVGVQKRGAEVGKQSSLLESFSTVTFLESRSSTNLTKFLEIVLSKFETRHENHCKVLPISFCLKNLNWRASVKTVSQ